MTDNTTPEPAAPKRLTGTRIVLYISLALNLLVLGLVLGAASHMWRSPEMRADRAMRDGGFSPYVAALSPEDRRAYIRDIFARAGDLRQNREAVRQEVETLLAILRAPDFDRAAFAASLESQSAKLEERRVAGIELFVARVSEMSAEKRQALADRIEQGMRRMRN